MEGEEVKMTSITFRMPVPSAQIIKQMAKERNIAESIIYRQAVAEYLDNKNPVICNECGAVNKHDANFCVSCGNKLDEEGEKIFEIFEELKTKYPNEFEKALKKLK